MRRYRWNSFFLWTLATVICFAKAQANNCWTDKATENAKRQVCLMLEALEDSGQEGNPVTLKRNGEVFYCNCQDWRSGFFPGTLWQLYELTEDSALLLPAKKHTEKLEEAKRLTRHHDIGFIIGCSFGNGFRLARKKEYADVIVEAARTLAARFREKTRTIQSWNVNCNNWQSKRGWKYPVIIDNLMNLELLFNATKLSGDSSFYKIAVAHADRTLQEHFRNDGSCYHVVDYNPENGHVRSRQTAQGYRDESAWSRGQAWAIYGYSMCYRETGDKKYLRQALKTFGFMKGHRNMPSDFIPYWDMDAPDIPDEPRDASSAAVIASALYEMSSYNIPESASCREYADCIMKSLSSERYTAPVGQNGRFILMHGTGSVPHNNAVNAPLIYADYYYVEALKRRKEIDKGKSAGTLREHPRLLFTSDEERRVSQLAKNNPLAKALSDFLKEQADSLVGVPQIPYKKDRYGNILHTSRSYLFRLGTLALAYRLNKEKKYLDAANNALLWVCGYPDWCPDHFLDTAEMSTCVAIAYDWLYNALPDSTKQIARECLYKRSISAALHEYSNGDNRSWAKRENNWNVVCNTGMTLAALAVAEHYPKEAEKILLNAARYMPDCLQHFAPDGVCYEGPAYWGYTVSFLSLYLKAVTDNGGDKAGISSLPGIPETALFYKRTLSPSGKRFNFGDANEEETLNTPAFFFYSRYYKQPEIAEWYQNIIADILKNKKDVFRTFFLALPWFDSSKMEIPPCTPKLQIFHNAINDIAVFNGCKKQKGHIFLIAKGGQPNNAHQQMDGGTFLLESDSTCWTAELGADDYALPGFWDKRQGGRRWSYFRNTNIAHNTISIDKTLQNADGRAFIREYNAKSSQPYAIIDMTTLYETKANSALRKFTLLDDYTVEMEDSVVLKKEESVLTWTMLTQADIEIVSTDKLILKMNGAELFVKAISPNNATLEISAAKNVDCREKPILGTSLIKLNCKFKRGKGKIAVRMGSKDSPDI